MEQRISKDFFEIWMYRLLRKLEAVDNKINNITGNQTPENEERLLDNQDLCQLLKISSRTLQRYRSKNLLPYYVIKGKTYYKFSDIQEYIKKCDN